MSAAPRGREFHTIGEVCELLGIKAHVLRYWETQFPELRPVKNRAGNRLYRASDLERIALIRRLVHEERYTLEGARQRLEEMRGSGADSPPAAAAALDRAVLQEIREEMERIITLLSPRRR